MIADWIREMHEGDETKRRFSNECVVRATLHDGQALLYKVGGEIRTVLLRTAPGDSLYDS
jgi:hypothetical protein